MFIPEYSRKHNNPRTQHVHSDYTEPRESLSDPGRLRRLPAHAESPRGTARCADRPS